MPLTSLFSSNGMGTTQQTIMPTNGRRLWPASSNSIRYLYWSPDECQCDNVGKKIKGLDPKDLQNRSPTRPLQMTVICGKVTADNLLHFHTSLMIIKWRLGNELIIQNPKSTTIWMWYWLLFSKRTENYCNRLQGRMTLYTSDLLLVLESPLLCPPEEFLLADHQEISAANAESITNNMIQTKQLKRESEKQMI